MRMESASAENRCKSGVEKMKKIMILGASMSQVPLIRAAREEGLYTIVASTPGDWPGFAQGDESSFTDISDPEAVLREARRHEIQGIATCCMDAGVPALGYVCEQMGLFGPGMNAARTARNKFLMKEAFRKNGVSCAEHRKVTTEEELEEAIKRFGFPVAVKAVDQMGSRGIYRCDTYEAAGNCFRSIMESSKEGYCLVEEFIEGTLFNGEAMVRNGQFVFCMTDNTEAYAAAVPTPVGHSFPFEKEKELGEMARREMQKAVQAVGYDNSAVDFDLLYRDGKVYVVEINGRAGATCLQELVSITYQVDYYKALVKLAMGEPVAEMFRKPSGNFACLSHILSSDKEGRLLSVVNWNDESDPDIVEISVDVKPGDLVRKYTNGRDRLGQVILKGKSLRGVKEKLEEVRRNLVFHVEG